MRKAYCRRLLPLESGLLARHVISVSTITFFEGRLEEIEEVMKKRFEKICFYNPWLLGRLKESKDEEGLSLHYHHPFVLNDFHKAFEVHQNLLHIHSKMDYTTLLNHTAPFLVQKPQSIINKESLVSRLLFEPLEDNPQKFVMIFSLSHSVADGHTYYQILNMLGGTQEIKRLNVARKFEKIAKMKRAISLVSYQYFTGFSHLLNGIRGSIFGKKSIAYAYYLDAPKIETLKKEKPSSLSFISTNDIISSHFFRLIQARIGFMAVNFRDKLEGLEEKDAGNYEGAIFCDKKGYDTPASIRKKLLKGIPYRFKKEQLPSSFKSLFCRLGLISNWSDFSKVLKIDGAKEILHLPLLGKVNASPYDICIIFRATKHKKGVIIVNKTVTKEKIKAQMPIDDIIL